MSLLRTGAELLRGGAELLCHCWEGGGDIAELMLGGRRIVSCAAHPYMRQKKVPLNAIVCYHGLARCFVVIKIE